MLMHVHKKGTIPKLQVVTGGKAGRYSHNGKGMNDLLFHFLQPPRRRQLESALLQNGAIGLILLNIEDYYAFQKVYGQEIAGYLLDVIERALTREATEILKDCSFLFVEKLQSGDFAVLFEKGPLELDALPDLAVSLRLSMRNRLNQELVQLIGRRLDVSSGYAFIRGHEAMNMEPALYHGLCYAREIAKERLDLTQLRFLDEFREILEAPRLTVVYQPIVFLRSHEVLGWESLARGPVQSYFRSPVVLFDFAEEAGALFSLETVCREQAIRHLGELAAGQKLFLNIHPRTPTDPNFSSGETLRLLQKYGLGPHNVVFEITERHSITEFILFHRTLEHYRKQGYLVAIDDVGTGYTRLSSIAEIRPEFIKIDMSLIRGIDTNPVKRALLETFVAFADKIGCGIIGHWFS